MLEIGSLVDGKYKILSVIGRGGMSVVYMAINEAANKTWAIKEVRKDGMADCQAVKQGLIAETDMLKQLKHKHLPSIVDVIEDEQTFLIVMDYIEGNSLKFELDEYGAQSQEDVVSWAMQVCNLLGYLHSREKPIIYRDLKPANIMLKPDGNIMVIDFGTAREFKDERKAEDTTCLGTAGYAAPEQYKGSGLGQTDARTDIFGLGATMYHLITGHNPGEPPYEMKPIREVNPDLSIGLEEIILKCTSQDPSKRYQSAAELMYALENYDTIDRVSNQKKRKKLNRFITTSAMAIAFSSVGLVIGFVANQKATDTYRQGLEEAAKATDYEEKLAIYERCINIPEKAGEKEAYIQLMKTFKENDGVFTTEEATRVTKYIKNHKDDLKKNPENYTDVCFELGKMYWYYYDYGNTGNNQVTKAKSSIEWFRDVVNIAPEGYLNRDMANVYASIGTFYRDITTDITEADDKGKYKPFFENISELLDNVAEDEEESEIVRLELLELSRSALQQYATKFKGDGITAKEIMEVYRQISKTVKSIVTTTDTTAEKKKSTLALMETTEKAIVNAYSSRQEGGNEI
jgi:serine/threonine-protein kinase